MRGEHGGDSGEPGRLKEASGLSWRHMSKKQVEWDDVIGLWAHGRPESTLYVYRPVITHFRASPEVDAGEPEHIRRLVGAPVGNRQLDFRGGLDVRGWEICLRDTAKVDVKIGRRPCGGWLGNIDHPDAQA